MVHTGCCVQLLPSRRIFLDAPYWGCSGYDKEPLCRGVSTIFFASFAHFSVSASGVREFLLGTTAICVSFQIWFKSCLVRSRLLTFFPTSVNALSTLTPRHVPNRPLVTMSTAIYWRNYIASLLRIQLPGRSDYRWRLLGFSILQYGTTDTGKFYSWCPTTTQCNTSFHWGASRAPRSEVTMLTLILCA